ncbi:glycosyl-transferase for dystroglycan-domain-containing protein [Umbelopsis sp. PMI_123]|nr:glycosyl-transferase for dystroglycan-domain-containing protein [Umbelopsis sp. PMI_123]
MGTANVTPYYFKASKEIDVNDITISTLVTHDRFPVLARLVNNYKGPVSATIHINDDEQREKILDDLQQIYNTEPMVRQYLDVHMVIDKYDRQFNLWRNIAKLFARTEYVMMLDVDFHICTDFRESIHQNPKAMELLKSGKAALVVPAFEFNKQSDGLDYKTFPNTKKDLLELVTKDKIDMFHKRWTPGHGDTNYTAWYTSSKPYRTTTYQYSYEPYIIYKREGIPWCDERFIGYGSNKAACLYEIHISGVDYWVLPNDFLIHQTHYYPEDTRTKERRYNRKLYEVFREEVCLRYSRKFKARGVWDGPGAANARKECSKVRGFKSTAASLD